MHIPQFIIAAPASGSGKTTVTRALMAALTRRGMGVQPFKCGPDYIDTKFHTAVCGRPSVNLDTFLATPAHARALYAHYATGSDACIVEGMMGLFDGYDRARGSTAEVAKLLGLPVVLVVDAAHAAYSTAPLLAGFAHFSPEVRLCGVLFNKVGSPRHARLLRQAAADAGVPCLGCLPTRKGQEQPSRYLGLDFAQLPDDDGGAQWVEDNVDVGQILDSASPSSPQLPQSGGGELRTGIEQEGSSCAPTAFAMSPQSGGLAGAPGEPRPHFVIASNGDAFSFIYQAHLDLLARLGRVTLFDPERDFDLPADTQLLYLPGGYPEQHAAALQAAAGTRQSIRRYAQAGGRVLAECGGMMYLCDRLLCDDGDYEMCGVLPFTVSARKADRRLCLGYRQMECNGLPLRGHEFHYSQFHGTQPPSATTVRNAMGEEVGSPLIRLGNVIASYTHLYWAELGNPLRLFD